MISRLIAALSLLICLAVPFVYFWGQIADGTFKTVLAFGSICWFAAGTLAIKKKTPAS